ncbi:N-acetylglucosamine kinase [Camelliibacillus cellulosilyticus]|uniref:N-acetylglucosamine kinase n=1 Tax=Camelliibacillus cellulosilyticus TaxID=2174486 RepID=A0ABV9GQ12_9BACL
MEPGAMKHVPILAMDAGGTSCRAALCDAEGNILSYTKGSSSNYHNIGLQKTKETIIHVLEELARPHGEPLKIAKAVIGMAGIDSKSAYQDLLTIIKSAFEKTRMQVEDILLNNDGFITLLGFLGNRPGLLVISGTGSIVCGKDEKGALVRVGGWGHQLGDPGSGYHIGKAALTHVFRSMDGQEPPTTLVPEILHELALDDLDHLVSWLYSDAYSIDKVASLATVVFKLAHAKHPLATSILLEAGKDLADACHTAIQRLRLENNAFDLVVAGGVLQKDHLVLGNMTERLAENHPNFMLHQLKSEPIHCAILYGLRSLNQYSDAAALRYEESLKQWEQDFIT